MAARVLNKNSLFILVTLESEDKIVETLGLIDSGAGGKFIDQNFAKEEGLKTKDLENPLVVYNIDGTLNKKGTIRKYVELPMTINGKKTLEQLMVTGLGKLKIILGFPWLNEQNPVIDWKIGTVSFPEKKKINWKWLIGSRNPKTSFAKEVDEEEWKNRTINRLDEDEPSILLVTLLGKLDTDIWINAKTNYGHGHRSQPQEEGGTVIYHIFIKFFSQLYPDVPIPIPTSDCTTLLIIFLFLSSDFHMLL